MTTQADLETTLSQLISIPSVSSNSVACREVIDFILDELAPYNLFISSDLDSLNPWVIATTKDTKEPDIMLAAHLDVLPAPTEMFTMQKIDSKLIGRGTYDMKLAAACYLEFLKSHKDILKDLNIGLMFTTDEEIGGDCMPKILESGWRPGVVFIPDGGGDWKVEGRAKGFWDVEIIARGKTAHGSRPWEGDNALHKLIDVLNILRSSFPSSEPSDSTLAINQINGGMAINQIADYAVARLDFRSFSSDEISLYKAQLNQLALKYNLEINPTQHGAPINFDKNAPVVQGFLKELRHITGRDVEYIESFGGTDARYFAEYNIPCIIMEPYGGGRHAPDEWLLADDLLTYYHLIENWLTNSRQPLELAKEFVSKEA
ncbi:MAG TPA: M20/M25/M40 family metallo-hydrolase [Candidatus Saccharimonadales bacterium]